MENNFYVWKDHFMKKQTPQELEEIQQAILAREVEEELQKERLLNFWNKYRFLIVGGVFAIILSTAGTEFYHSWRNKVRLAESNNFESAVVLVATGEQEKAAKALKTISQEAKTDYKYLAELRLAGLDLQNNKLDEALQKLKAIYENTSAPSALRNIARLSYVGHQIDTQDENTLLPILSDLLKPQSEYYSAAIELKTAILLKQNKKEEARQLLQNAVLNPNLTPDTVNRLKSFLSAI